MKAPALHTLEHFLLPGTDLRVSRLSIGTALWGSVVTGDRLERLFAAYTEAGGNFFDTAHCYAFWRDGLGASEKAVGELVRKSGRRENVVIATKCAHPDGGPGYPRPDCVLSPERIHADVDDSLARLGCDAVDVLYLHRDDSRLPVAEIIDAANAEVRAGRVRYLGASNWTVARIREANAYAEGRRLAGFAVSQPQWSLAHPNAPVAETDPAMRHLTAAERRWHEATGFPLVAYTSSANGYISAAPKPASAAFDNPISQARRGRALQLAAELQVAPNSVALAYLLSQPFPVIPVIGTSDLDHWREALAATEVRLTSAQLAWLESGGIPQ